MYRYQANVWYLDNTEDNKIVEKKEINIMAEEQINLLTAIVMP
jgi:hypothetical protein